MTTKTVTDKDRFCEYYNCSIQKTDKVAIYENFSFGPPIVQVGTDDKPNYIQEPVYNIQITEGMLQDLIQHTNKMIEECEMRKTDPRLMKMYSEYITMLNLLK